MKRFVDYKTHNCTCTIGPLQNPAKAKVTRKFLVAEAVYLNYGDMAPLPRLVSVCVCVCYAVYCL